MTRDYPTSKVEAVEDAAERIETYWCDKRLVWHCWGRGTPVVLLHGGAGSWRHWVRNIPALAQHHQVFAVDMPGLGSSDSPDEPWTLDVSAKIIADGIETLLGQNGQFALVGFSAGAMLSGLVSERLQLRCRCLVIVGAGGLGTARHNIPLEKVRSKQGEERRQAHFINLSRLLIADSDKIDEQAIAIQDWNSIRARVNSSPFSHSAVLKDALARSNVPLKAIWGSADAPARGTLEERCSILRQLRPGVEIAIIPGAGHWVAYEAADTFNTILIDYLKLDVPSIRGSSATV